MFMSVKKDDILYVCSMIEFVARKTNNKPKDVVSQMSVNAIEHQLKVASVNHCLSFEQVSDEWIEDYDITSGTYNNISSCHYEVPSYTAIGRVYEELISRVSEPGEEAKTLKRVFMSFISDEISNYNSSVYYSNPDYLKCSYEEGKLLA